MRLDMGRHYPVFPCKGLKLLAQTTFDRAKPGKETKNEKHYYPYFH